MNISQTQYMFIITFNTFFLLKKDVLSTYRKRRTELLIHVHRLPSTVQDCRISGVKSLLQFVKLYAQQSLHLLYKRCYMFLKQNLNLRNAFLYVRVDKRAL